MRSLCNTSTHDQQWELNSRPSDLEKNALSTQPYAPVTTTAAASAASFQN